MRLLPSVDVVVVVINLPENRTLIPRYLLYMVSMTLTIGSWQSRHTSPPWSADVTDAPAMLTLPPICQTLQLFYPSSGILRIILQWFWQPKWQNEQPCCIPRIIFDANSNHSEWSVDGVLSFYSQGVINVHIVYILLSLCVYMYWGMSDSHFSSHPSLVHVDIWEACKIFSQQRSIAVIRHLASALWIRIPGSNPIWSAFVFYLRSTHPAWFSLSRWFRTPSTPTPTPNSAAERLRWKKKRIDNKHKHQTNITLIVATRKRRDKPSTILIIPRFLLFRRCPQIDCGSQFSTAH